MNYKLTPLFTEADIQKEVDAFIQRVIKVLTNELAQLGLEMVNSARDKAPEVSYHRDAKDILIATRLAGGSVDLASAGGFNDQTGNLRSSMFYRIAYDGQVLAEDFQSFGGAEGVTTGRAYADQITRENSKGWAIIIGAGMEYGSWVEAKGYDVITGSTLGAGRRLQQALENVRRAFE